MLRLGQKVVIIHDRFEQDLPMGEYGYIIAYDRNPDNAFDYVVRVPKRGRNFLVPACDVELEESLLKKAVDEVERAALIDYALATRNEALFYQIVQGNEEPSEQQPKEIPNKDFLRQIHLKAWI